MAECLPYAVSSLASGQVSVIFHISQEDGAEFMHDIHALLKKPVKLRIYGIER